MTSAARSSAFADVSQRLQTVGFKKRAGLLFTRDIADDVLGWLGLNRASRHTPAGCYEINPVVGIRHQGVERIIAELRKEKFHPYMPPTVSRPLGYLMPDPRYRSWTVSETNSGQSINSLIEAIEDHAAPFIESHATLAGVCELLDDKMGFDHQLVYRRPVAWLLAGDIPRALRLVATAEEALGGRSDAAALEFRSFAAEFQRYAGVSHTG
ncbi:MAG: hypothetical protein LBI84_10470 [Propionibacteriaceae bacterium]|jgi:hypothetical protein|nr:hypothetical protein [Propionibacteriaceae bacterium]